MACCARAIIGKPRLAVPAAAPAPRNERRLFDMVALPGMDARRAPVVASRSRSSPSLNGAGPSRALATTVTRAGVFLAAALCCTALAQEAPRGGALFLVADPSLADPNFGKTVVLVARHAEVAGPIGVVINRPTEIAVERAFPDARKLVGAGDKLYVGGPVAPHVFFYVLRASEAPPDAVEVADG